MSDELTVSDNHPSIPNAILPDASIPRAEVILDKGQILDLPQRALVLVRCPEEIVNDVRVAVKQVIDFVERPDVCVFVVPDSIEFHVFDPII